MLRSGELFVRRGGEGGPVLLLLHGLGATGAVWDGLCALLPDAWPGGWVVPDLPGHGRSAPLPRYSFGGLAAELARLVAVAGERTPFVALGHSLGGAVALALGSGWFDARPSAVAGVGIKVRWTAEELGKAAEMAARPPRTFPTREETADRALRVAGLAGLVPADGPLVDGAVVPSEGGWRLALDPAAFAVGAPDMEGMLGSCHAAGVPVVLAAGEFDPMSPLEHLQPLVPDPLVLKGLGHNAHVEDPAALLPIIERLAGGR